MDSVEFKKLVLPYGRKLFHFARLLLKDEYIAQDAVQEVYIKLWEMRDELSKIKSMEAFVMRITKNWCLDRLKAKKAILIDNYSHGYDRPNEAQEPYKVMERNDKIKNLYAIMDKLPEQQKTILKLRDIDGYDYEEIASITELNESTIRVNLSRARKKVREDLLKIENYGHTKSRATN